MKIIKKLVRNLSTRIDRNWWVETARIAAKAKNWPASKRAGINVSNQRLKIGPMHLLKVSGVFEKCMPDGLIIYVIHFDDCKLAVTDLHAFTTIQETTKTVRQLKKGDQIWVDLYAFQTDGSFTKNKFKRQTNDHLLGCRCRRCE